MVVEYGVMVSRSRISHSGAGCSEVLGHCPSVQNESLRC